MANFEDFKKSVETVKQTARDMRQLADKTLKYAVTRIKGRWERLTPDQLRLGQCISSLLRSFNSSKRLSFEYPQDGLNQTKNQIYSCIDDVIKNGLKMVRVNITKPLSQVVGDTPERKDRLLEMATQNKCEINSMEIMRLMENKFPGSIIHYVLLRSMGEKGKSAFNGNWAWHTYFLMQSKDGTWFAGSPANFHPSKRPDIIEDLIYSEDLKVVMGKIERAAGGKWPSPDFILSQINDQRFCGTHYKRPDGSCGINIGMVSHGKDGVDRILDNYVVKTS